MLQAIEKSPDARPPTAEALAEALESAMAEYGESRSIQRLKITGSGLQKASYSGIDPLGESKPQVEKPPPPEAGLPIRLTIIDADDEGHKSRTISGDVLDLSLQGMCIQTSAVESDSLNIIKDHTVAFKNRLNIEIVQTAEHTFVFGCVVMYRRGKGHIGVQYLFKVNVL